MIKSNSSDSSDPQLHGDLLPLTQNQRLFWMGQKLNPEIPLYNMIMTFTFKGEVDLDKFRQAFAILVKQTDVLRTIFVEHQGMPWQQVMEDYSYDLEVVDFRRNENPQKLYENWLDQRKTRVLAWDRPLFDAALIRFEKEVVWYLNQHHLITDGHAFEILYRRFHGLYHQLLKGGPELVAVELPQYKEFIAHENSLKGSEQVDGARLYWENKTSVSVPPLTLYQRSTENLASRTRRLHWRISPEDNCKLDSILASEEFFSISGEMSLMAVFFTISATVLSVISGKDQIRIGTPFHARSSKAFKETVGLFIEIGLVQGEIAPEDTFYTLYQKLLQDSFDSMMNIRAGVSTAQMNRSYAVFLNYFNGQFPDFGDDPVEVDWIHTGYGDQAHALRIQWTKFKHDGYSLYFDLNESLFDRRLQKKFLSHFRAVFNLFLKDHHQIINRIDLRSPEDNKLWASFDQTGQSIPESTTIAQFEQQVLKTPQQVAMLQEDESITYDLLNSRSNQLANLLRDRGVSSGAKVAFILDRSFEAVISILGILKSGACFVPIDTNYPRERITYLIRDSQPTLVITKEPLQLEDTQILNIANLSWSQQGTQNPKVDNQWSDLAYILYTSGSTGRPKGVQVSHLGLANYLTWAGDYYLQGKALDFPLFTSLAFDLTLTSVFLPLLNGGKLVVYPTAHHGLEVLSVFQEDSVDVVKLTPSHLSLLSHQSSSIKNIHKLILGGEKLSTELAKSTLDKFGEEIEIYNEYGPTEGTIGCMIHRYDPKADTGSSVPIGKPIRNIQIELLRSGLPVPAEIPGEIFIRGAGVAQGYLNLPEMTSERFIPSPQGNDIRYATGDLGVLNQKGELIFLGREDRQIKINGTRIELDELKVQLEQHPSIQQAILKIEKNEPGTPATTKFCNNCGLPSNYPEVKFDDRGICNFCLEFEVYRKDVLKYFKSKSELEEIIKQTKEEARGDYHCMMLLSGGKDSSYVLAKLVDKGLNVLAWTLDNGFISQQAKENMRRLADHLGVDLIVATTSHMNAIFADSLKTHSNVCHGCYKTIYTLSIKEALKHNIQVIFTGLSRGQLFETRLQELFRNRMLEVTEMDQAILKARKLYHRIEDVPNRLLDNSLFLSDQIFNEIKFVDYFRYSSVRLEEMYQYLQTKVPWIRPDDTGRSTNCLINEAGIFVHKTERGYHNYALPYSWDVRLGHKTREQALDELDDEIRVPMVYEMLEKVGYQVAKPIRNSGDRLVAYYQSDSGLSPIEVLEYCKQKFPDYMVPHSFMEIDHVPLTTNGKIDYQKLPTADQGTRSAEKDSRYVAPETEIEEWLTKFWMQSLGIKQIGITDNFFDLGGHSMPAVQIVSNINQHFQLNFPIASFFEKPDIKSQSRIVEDLILSEIEAMSDEAVERLSGEQPDQEVKK